ncbi:MAG: cyclase family protein [Polyangia bacterium]|jgi:kynurenine formamidase|nr:cyclase family protein [Polyangia bacterium]
MLPIDLSIPLGIGTPAWPTYEPLQMKYFKRLAPNGANGQLLTHSNHVGTHLDGEIHFFTPGRDIAQLPLDYLMHDGVIVDLSDAVGSYDIYTSKMVEERVEVREGDILIIHTGFHHFGWDQPTADEVSYMVKHPGPDREFALWARKKKLRWIGVDCGSADHPMNTIIRNWMPRQAKEADQHFRHKYGKSVEEVFDDSKYQLMHIEMFNHQIIHAECLGGDIDLLLNQRAVIGAFPWRLVDGESCICRILAFVDNDRHIELMARKSECSLTKHGDVAGSMNPELHEEGRQRAARRRARSADRARPVRPASPSKPEKTPKSRTRRATKR